MSAEIKQDLVISYQLSVISLVTVHCLLIADDGWVTESLRLDTVFIDLFE